jgi:hypothetical protein
MAKTGYGVLLVVVAAMSFAGGVTFGNGATPPTPAEVPPTVDVARFTALERRVDVLLSERATPAIQTVPAVQREGVDAASPALAEAVVALREAVLAIGHAESQRVVATRSPSPTNWAAVRQIAAVATKDGYVENSDLIMLPVSEVLARLGRPSYANSLSDGEWHMKYHIAPDTVCITIKNGVVFYVNVERQTS